MKVTLDVHHIDWENKSTSSIGPTVFEGDAKEIIYNLTGFLINGDGEWQIVIKSMRVD